MERRARDVNSAIVRGEDTAEIVKMLEAHKREAPGNYNQCHAMGGHPVRALAYDRFDVLDWVWNERAAAGCADQYFAHVFSSAIQRPDTLALEWLRKKRPDVGSWRSNDAIMRIIIHCRHREWFEDYCSLPDLLLNHLAALAITYFAHDAHLMQFVLSVSELGQAQLQIELLKFAANYGVAFAAEHRGSKEVPKFEAKIVKAFAVHREAMRRWLTADNGKALAKLFSDADIGAQHYMRAVLRRIGFTASDFASAGLPS